jgi:pilus assembly protein CpaF
MKKIKNLKDIFNGIYDLYINDGVSEIMINSKNEIYCEERGKIRKVDFEFSNDEEIMTLMRNIFEWSGKKIADHFSTCEARLPDGSFVSAMTSPISINGPALVIRKIPLKAFTFEDLIKFKSLTQEGLEILQKIMNTHKGLLVSGGTGSARTTLSNCIVQLIPNHYRLVVIEKFAEMIIPNRHCLRLQAEEGSSESFAKLIHFSKSLRADHVFIRELEGSETTQAINLGRCGHTVHASIHAEDPIDALKRLELMYMKGDSIPGIDEIRKIIMDAIPYIVQLDRVANGRRIITSINRLDGLNENGHFIINSLYRYDDELDQHKITKIGKMFMENSVEKKEGIKI